MIENPENKRVDELLEQLHDMGISDDMLAVKLKGDKQGYTQIRSNIKPFEDEWIEEAKRAEAAGEIAGEDKLEQLKKRLKEHPEDMIILSELMKPKF
ncbi:MAG TPA: hypothetical protein PK500_02510 [Candidatus Egerieousia sp.]|nr:hypothetical protein [Candidatus Egerieousia sp.]HPT05513.1 hypothetical protein [Candidatus Egerieousia sp.]